MSEYENLLREAYLGEIFGAALFDALAEAQPDADRREKLRTLETVEARLGPISAEQTVRFGEPEEEILTEAEAFDADLIVATTARPTGWLSRFGRGGIGERLLRDSPVPVVLVRPA